MQQERFSILSGAPGSVSGSGLFEPELEFDLPQCCGTGCAVCVLDYPELFSINQTDSGPMDSNMLTLLEAVEQAQARAQAGQMIVIGDLQ